MKKCHVCGKEKSFDSFTRKKDGLNYDCKDCRKIYSKKHYIANKQYYKNKTKIRTKELRDWLREFKSGLKCEECGEDHPACIEYHHLDMTKKDFEISKAITKGFAKERILEEIKKCMVLCSNCHKKLHYDNKSGIYVYLNEL